MHDYALLRCLDCEHEFADRLPDLCNELPPCPLCRGMTHIWRILRDHILS